ncbi:MAG: hypothetical protein ABIJ21_06755 [Nanoarchaeota archaeon]
MGIAVEKRLQDAGYRLLGDGDGIESLILDILKSKNSRYLKAIPFLIYKYDLDISSIRKKLKSDEGDIFRTIVNFTGRIFNELNMRKNVPMFRKRNTGRECDLNFQEFKDEFELQLRNESSPRLLIDTQKIDEERNLQFALSQLFTKKERQIIRSLQEDRSVSKTDYEYYSRKTKKKFRSILSLHDFALGISSKIPKIDKETR